MDDAALVWFRRDLRVRDHAALAGALAGARRVYCAFVFDREILDPLRDRPRTADRRVDFIHRSVLELDARLRTDGGGLIVRHERAREAIPRLAAQLGVGTVLAAADVAPAAVARDAQVARALTADGRRLVLVKDQVVFDHGEILTRSGGPYGVYTPYRNAWLKALAAAPPVAHRSEALLERHGLPAPPPGAGIPALDEMGFAPTGLDALGVQAGEAGARALLARFLERIDAYHLERDTPALDSPSRLSVHLRFGTVSIRELVAAARQRPGEGAAAWLSELVWREFYQMILAHHPHVVEHAYRPQYERIAWVEDEAAFTAWCAGRTGYPLVDAAMTQLATTGYMHNRLRMVVASFLTKDLGIDWRRGERLFGRALLDYELASNNGGWQWAASTGCDAQPYFRVFNPITQSRRFDPQGRFIRRHLPALARYGDAEIHAPWLVAPERQSALGCRIGTDYPAPIVEHGPARARALARFASARA